MDMTEFYGFAVPGFILKLSDNIVIEKRTRYSVWDLLGDVGGFNDGLILLCQLLTSFYTAISFKTKFLAATFFDSDSDANDRSNSAHRSTFLTLTEQPDSNRIDASVFAGALRSAESLKQSFWCNLLLWNCQKRR